MNEREFSLIKALGDEFSQVLSAMRNELTKALEDQQSVFTEQVRRLSLELSSLKSAPAPDIEGLVDAALAKLPAPQAPELPDIVALVNEAVARLPAPQDGKSLSPDDVRPILQQMVDKAAAAIPTPRDGKDYELAVLKQAVTDAVNALPAPRDGTSVTIDDVRPMLKEIVIAALPELPDVPTLVSEALAALPAPEPAQPGKPGVDGKDALQIEILPGIDEEKSYPRGSYATHNGGLWRTFEKTSGLRGWECLVDGVAGIDIKQDNQRSFSITVMRASGASETKTFDTPVMIYRGVFKSGEAYLPGDTVTWGGSLWHCDESTADKPGEIGSSGWTLATKRGRDGRDKS